jgi:uncharacterized protein
VWNREFAKPFVVRAPQAPLSRNLVTHLRYAKSILNIWVSCEAGEGIGRDSVGFQPTTGRLVLFNPKMLSSVPNIGTIVPGMGTHVLSLSKVLFGQSRRAILALLYGHADGQFYLREIARRAGTGIGATQRELGQLTDAGLLHRLRRGNQVYYRANCENPIFEELKSILAKTSGIRDTLQEGLARLADRVKLAFVYGSIARGEEKASSDVDLMVVGNVSFQDVVAALSEIERKLGREVNPTVFGPREFREKLAAKNRFLSSLAKEKKLFVIGDESEFRRLGQ